MHKWNPENLKLVAVGQLLERYIAVGQLLERYMDFWCKSVSRLNKQELCYIISDVSFIKIHFLENLGIFQFPHK